MIVWRGLTAEQRFWSRVDTSVGPDVCWLWKGARLPRGYGKFQAEGAQVGAHVYSFYLHGGTLADGEEVCHSCDNPPCVNPGHLFAGTRLVNVRDMIDKGRLRKPRGKAHYRAKLTEADVRSIRASAAAGVPIPDVAREHHVDQKTIRQIVARIRWKHVEDRVLPPEVEQ